jgi:uncharacterized membrane protein
MEEIMAILNTRELRSRAASAVRENQTELRRLILLYCGVLAGLSLASAGLNLYLDDQIGTTGGLGGLGLRSVLQTIQAVLSYINLFFTPFWSAGFLYAVIAMVRGGAPRLGHMTEGFRRFGRILSSAMYESALMIALAAAALVVVMMFFMLSPWGTMVAQMMEPVIHDPNLFLPDGTVNIAAMPQNVMIAGVIPMVILWGLLTLAGYVFLSYCFRMAGFLMMERWIGGIAALFLSLRLMRGHKWQIFKMDLGYWWYYLLLAGVTLVGNLDAICILVGIALPFDAVTAYFVTMTVYLALQTLIFLWKKGEVDAAFVLAFEAIAHPETEEVK